MGLILVFYFLFIFGGIALFAVLFSALMFALEFVKTVLNEATR
jgi:hypothetical protein